MPLARKPSLQKQLQSLLEELLLGKLNSTIVIELQGPSNTPGNVQ